MSTDNLKHEDWCDRRCDCSGREIDAALRARIAALEAEKSTQADTILTQLRALAERDSLLDELVSLLKIAQRGKQSPGISTGPDSGSFNVVLHGNWFIAADASIARAKKLRMEIREESNENT